MLTKAEILAATDRQPTMVPCPEWGGDVAVYPMTCEQIEQLEAWVDANGMGPGYRVEVLKRCLGGEWTVAELSQLNQKQASVVKRLCRVAADLTQPDLKEIEGNSEAVQSGGDGSSSASSTAPLSVDLSNYSPEPSSTS